MSDGREVRRRDVARDFFERVDLVLTEPRGMLAHYRFVRRGIDAICPHLAGVVDHDVAVLPDDLGELALGELPRAPTDRAHLGLGDIETTDDHVTRHPVILTL